MNVKSHGLRLARPVIIGMAVAGLTPAVLADDPGVVVLTPITVSGERVDRSVQDTAASVSVFDEQRLSELSGADRIEQVIDMVVNTQKGSSDIGATIRGQDSTGVLLGANAFLGGTRPRATLQVDGRALNFNEFIYGPTGLWDVEKIEVFRGPQTTTQGRNAIAGAMFVDTKDPTFEPEGAGRLILGEYGTQQASAALSGPLVDDQVAARISVDWREQESWMNYTAPDVFVGANREDDNYTNARLKFLFTPTAAPDFEAMLTVNHLNATTPQNETADEPYEDRVQSMQNGAHWDTDVDSLTLDAMQALGENWELGLTGTYADSRSERFAAPGFGTAVVEADEYSLEALLRFDPPAGRVRGLLGISYFTADQEETSDLSAFLGMGEFTDAQRSIGAFGELTYDATSRLHLTAGGRFQQDTQMRVGTLGPVVLDYDEKFDEFLPKFEAAYDLGVDKVVGVSARKGFNPGGTTVSFATGEIDEFDAETLWSYELFSRASLAGGDLFVSGNLFYMDFDDAQRQLINVVELPGGRTAETSEFENAPSAESYGLEVEGLWALSQAVRLRASLGYLKTRITETLSPNDPILGKEFQRAPRYTSALGLIVTPNERLSFDVSVRHNSSYFSDDANSPEFKIDGVTVVDATVSYDFGPMRAFAYVRNATDEVYPVWQFRAGNSSLGDPREFGIGVEANF